MATPFRLYNTLTKRIEEFEPLQPGRVSIYVCGMTVYDHIHVGHARAMVVFDSFVRYLRYRGWQVNFVRNFTDVDDKIIMRAKENQEEPMTLAQRFIDAFRNDTAALGLIPPDAEPRVSTSIREIHELIGKLVEREHAYVNEGTVWFKVDSFEEYGKLSRQKVKELRSADDAAGKQAPYDFALWKAAKEGEPSWDSPWGPGRPGWHIECSAMANAALGETIDIHGGGLDLVFPHHENEIAQSECAHRKDYVRYWMHNGLLTMASGKKMGKSLGNVINVRDALSEYPAETLRMYYLQNHYRSPLPWSDTALLEALGMLSRLYEAYENASELTGSEPAASVVSSLGAEAKAVWELGEAFPRKFHSCLDQDFNTAQAIGHLFELARAVNRFAAHKKAKRRGGPVVAPAIAAFKLVSEALGLFQASPHMFFEEVKDKRLASLGLTRETVDSLLKQRSEARQNKDFSRADEIRDELTEKSIEVMDLADGVTWRVALATPEES